LGLEAICTCTVDGETAEAKALLESHELILRAPFRRTVRITSMRAVRVAGEALLIDTDDVRISLDLGAATAAKWAKKLLTPAPSLAQKLGIGHAHPALVIGEVSDPALAEALEGHSAPAGSAKLSVAIVGSGAELDDALTRHAALPSGSHIWVVHGKGPKAIFGDTPVRAHMRALGYRDSKVSAVSDTLSATRYSLG
jgi:hypothetical protein